jgi:hypothetical protein
MYYLNDIALFKLSKPVVLDDKVQVACLPNRLSKSEYPAPNTMSWAVGWGNYSLILSKKFKYSIIE